MKKAELLAKLEVAKEVTSVVSIDLIISALHELELPTQTGITQELAQEIADRIERTLDYNANDLVDKDEVTFSINYGNTIEIDDAQIDVATTMDHITACLDEFIIEEEDECGPSEDEVMQSVNEGLGTV